MSDLAANLRKRESKRNVHTKPELSPLTYMIAETMIPPGELDVTRFRGYGIGDRDPSTLPGRKAGSESEWDNRARSRYWQSRRKWVQSANSAGVKSHV